MSRYVVASTRLGVTVYSKPSERLGHIQDLAAIQAKTSNVVTILQEGGEPDYHPHPDNKGKFFLHLIVK